MKVETVGLPEFRRNLNFLEREAFPKAASRALNRTIATLRSRTVKAVAKRMGVKQKVVRDRMEIGRANPSKLEARLVLRGNALNLIHFKARQVQAGVSAAPWGRRRVFPTAFIARIRGSRVVMVRQKRGGERVGRLPIRPVLGPGIAKTAQARPIVQLRQRVVDERMPIEFNSALQFLTRRTSRGTGQIVFRAARQVGSSFRGSSE